MFFKMLNHRDVVPTHAASDASQAATNFHQPSTSTEDLLPFVCTSQTEIQALQGCIRLSHNLDSSSSLAAGFLDILESVYPTEASAIYQCFGEKWTPLATSGKGPSAFDGFLQDWDWREELLREKQAVAAMGEQAVFIFVPIRSHRNCSGMLLLEFGLMGEEKALHLLGFLTEMGANFAVALMASDALRAVNDLSEDISMLEELLPFAAVVDVAGGIAHDINNPLQIILGKIQVDKLRNEETPLHNELEEQAMRIATLTRGLMQLARPQLNNSNLIDFKAELQIVLSVLQRQIQKSGSEVILDFNGPIPLLKGSGQWLRQLLLTMVLAARRHNRQPQTLILSGGLANNAMHIDLKFSRDPDGNSARMETLAPVGLSLDRELIERRTISYLANCLDGEALFHLNGEKEGLIQITIPVGGSVSG